uniref:RH1 domain-containing protein n=1 Tax=Hydatigena taeniaeformis TaxID=6205 RepID=A0A0R3WS06_HYDTA
LAIETSVGDTTAHQEKSAVNSLTDAIGAAGEPLHSESNDDLEVLESLFIGMERVGCFLGCSSAVGFKHIEEMQFEILRLRQEDEAKRLKMNHPPLSLAEVLADLDRMLTSLEAHKTDYSVLVEIQEENIRLKEEVTRLNEEVQCLRRELETVNKAHAAQLVAVNLTTEEKLAALCKDYEAKLTKQSTQFTEMMDEERANFAAQRDAWNEERASVCVLQFGNLFQDNNIPLTINRYVADKNK